MSVYTPEELHEYFGDDLDDIRDAMRAERDAAQAARDRAGDPDAYDFEHPVTGNCPECTVDRELALGESLNYGKVIAYCITCSAQFDY